MPIGISHQTMGQMLGSLKTIGVAGGPSAQSAPPKPFITITRQMGALDHTVGKVLAERLSKRSPDDQPWQCFDHELIEKIAKDHHLSEDLIASLERSSHTWIEEFLNGLGHTDKTVSELAVFRRVVQTVRALAQAGHVILIGLGGVLITRDMPNALHVRLVAPLPWRIRNIARHHNVSDADALRMVNLLDQDREAFYRKFFPRQAVTAELFHMTLNAALMSDEQIVSAILPLVGAHTPAAVG